MSDNLKIHFHYSHLIFMCLIKTLIPNLQLGSFEQKSQFVNQSRKCGKRTKKANIK